MLMLGKLVPPLVVGGAVVVIQPWRFALCTGWYLVYLFPAFVRSVSMASI